MQKDLPTKVSKKQHSQTLTRQFDKVNKLYDDGWKIVYWTARGSVSKKDYTEYTRLQLENWGCKFHDLTTGMSENPKPHFDLVIDDKAKRIEELFPSDDNWFPDQGI